MFVLPEGLSIRWLGHSTVLLTLPGGERILIDPWTQHNPACPAEFKDPGKLDLMLITHGHSDHMGDAVALAKDSECTIACGYEIMLHLIGKGIAGHRFQPMNVGGSIHLPGHGLTLTQTYAQHSSGIDEGGKVHDGGAPAGFVVRLDSGFCLWNTGDTGLFSDMRLIGELYEPTLALLPIGDRFTMGPREAAMALSWLPTVRAVLPLHWGTFPLLTGTPQALESELRQRGIATEVLHCGPGEEI
jgi:L-ascorbate metabolism protein UlaG (beta-lactamase superfamily)